MAELTTKAKSKESLSILTNPQITRSTSRLSKSFSKELNGENDGYRQITTSRSYMTSFDDLLDQRRTLYTCYSSKAITMYNVSSGLKDHTGSTPNMFTLNKTIKTQKMTRSCSGDKSILSNFSASSQTLLAPSINTTASTKKKFKDKFFVFRKSRSAQQWLDEFLIRNVNDEKLEEEENKIIDSDSNLTTLFNLTDFDRNYEIQDLYNNIMKIGDNYRFTLDHIPFWQKLPKEFPETDVKDVQHLTRELNIFQDNPKMKIDGINYKVIEGKIIPYEGPLSAILNCLIFPTSQETQFTDAFLEVYRFYMTSEDLLEFIISWFNVKLPENPTPEQEFFYDENKKNIQIRCLKLLNFWIRLHWHDFNSSIVTSLLNKFMNHVSESINNTIIYAEYTKLDTVLRNQKLALFTKQYTFNVDGQSPVKSKFTVPESDKPWVLLMTTQEFSSQLLLHERTLFQEMEPDYYIYLLEGIRLTDEDFGRYTLYRPIRVFLNYVSWFHQLSLYTITTIAEQQSVRKKHFALKKFIKIAKNCINNKNYNSAAAIYFALKNQLFVRHHALWESLQGELIGYMEELDNLFCNSYNYHFELQQIELQPYPDENVIPFLFEHIKQLVEQTKFEDRITYDFNAEVRFNNYSIASNLNQRANYSADNLTQRNLSIDNLNQRDNLSADNLTQRVKNFSIDNLNQKVNNSNIERLNKETIDSDSNRNVIIENQCNDQNIINNCDQKENNPNSDDLNKDVNNASTTSNLDKNENNTTTIDNSNQNESNTNADDNLNQNQDNTTIDNMDQNENNVNNTDNSNQNENIENVDNLDKNENNTNNNEDSNQNENTTNAADNLTQNQDNTTTIDNMNQYDNNANAIDNSNQNENNTNNDNLDKNENNTNNIEDSTKSEDNSNDLNQNDSNATNNLDQNNTTVVDSSKENENNTGDNVDENSNNTTTDNINQNIENSNTENINQNNNNENDESDNESEDYYEKNLNILNWLSVNQIIMEIEKWRLNARSQILDSQKNNTSSNIIGDHITAEKTAYHIIHYPKWSRKQINEQTLPFNLSLKSSKSRRGKKNSVQYNKFNSLQDVLAPSPIFYSANDLNSSPLSAPPIDSKKLEIQPNGREFAAPITPMTPMTPEVSRLKPPEMINRLNTINSASTENSENLSITPDTSITPNTVI